MLSDDLKQSIQQNYSTLVKNKNLQNRPGQKRMIAEIANCLSSVEMDEEGKRISPYPPLCVVEAGTGIGKTIAYLLSVIPLAKAMEKKVVLATATVALQEQVMNKDIPDLLQNSDMQFSYSLAKGRGRYLCLSKLDNVLKSSSSQDAMFDLYGLELEDASEEDRAFYQDMLDALIDGKWKGDRDDWPTVINDSQWRNVAVEKGQCSGSRCSNYSNCCFFKSRGNLQKADCIVANHDLVLADLSLGGGVILPPPEECIYIFDEAHHLPLKGVNHFAHFIRLRSTMTWLDRMTAIHKGMTVELAKDDELKVQLEKAKVAAEQTRAILQQHLPMFQEFTDRSESANATGDITQYRFDQGVLPDAMREVSHNILLEFRELEDRLRKISDRLKDVMENDSGDIDRQTAENWFPVVGIMLTRAEGAISLWRSFSIEDHGDYAPHARWITYKPLGNETEITLSSSPVLAADALTDFLWNECFAAVLTSATLTALGTFDFLKMRSGLHENTVYKCIPSPFDFQNKANLRIPTEGFDPSDNDGHTQAIVELLPELIEEGKGALVLFSSRRQMQMVQQGLDESMQFNLLSQDEHSKQELIRLHKERVDKGQTSIIFGLASMTEGIDLPGDYCTNVVIAKIPFAVPNDPVEATLGEWIKGQGKNPFQEISVPEASMKLIQASGRLLRTESDTGTITILDERLLKKFYGKGILNSLPPYRLETFTRDVASVISEP
jgi:ATP-dependent DNA helicase DinG